jgi:hypothetical protein
MAWFRTTTPTTLAGLTQAMVPKVMAEVVLPAHFFTREPVALEWEFAASEDLPWEVLHGRLVDPAHTRQRRKFAAWNLFLTDEDGRSQEPLLSLKLDASEGRLHIVRSIHCYAWEGYDAGDRVFLSREVRKWLRELVGTIELGRFGSVEELRDELICRLFQAVVGTSRLPLTSVEAPLPAFSLGRLAYCYREHLDAAEDKGQSVRSSQDWIRATLAPNLAWLEKVKLLELVVRACPHNELDRAADLFAECWQATGHGRHTVPRLLRSLFEEVSLSPYSDFVEKALAFVEHLEARGAIQRDEQIDFLSYLLRHIGRHLTAYDLVTFHHRGANYPDLLLVDAVLKRYLGLIEGSPWLFRSETEHASAKRHRLRRRALRHSWLLRRRYEGHRVPDAPTSPGENARVLPAPHVRVPDEQITEPSQRSKRLFADDPLTLYLQENARQVLRQSIRDLVHEEELQELGMALFLDRPLGVFKHPAEPDQTILLSYEAFSRSIAQGRLRYLAQELDLLAGPEEWAALDDYLSELRIEGIRLESTPRSVRPGAVRLEDAFQVAPDFVFLRTTRRSLTRFLEWVSDAVQAGQVPLSALLSEPNLLLTRGETIGTSERGKLIVFDSQLRKRLELQIDPQGGYASRGAVEYPAAGLRVINA